ncbi:hypothetical protein D9M71_811710 [compost metagenome]
MKCGVVGAETSGEDQRGFLLMPFSQAFLEPFIGFIRPADVARAPGAGPVGF